MSNTEKLEIAEWVKNLCLMSGSSVYTAYKVAGFFVEGLEQEWKQNGRRGGSA